jgi:hypothetical protein
VKDHLGEIVSFQFRTKLNNNSLSKSAMNIDGFQQKKQNRTRRRSSVSTASDGKDTSPTFHNSRNSIPMEEPQSPVIKRPTLRLSLAPTGTERRGSGSPQLSPQVSSHALVTSEGHVSRVSIAEESDATSSTGTVQKSPSFNPMLTNEVNISSVLVFESGSRSGIEFAPYSPSTPPSFLLKQK